MKYAARVAMVLVLACAGAAAKERHVHETDLVPPEQRATRIVVDKSRQILWLYRHDKVIATYTDVRLGMHPRGHKRESEDGRTPVGTYEIVKRNKHSRFHLSLEVSYPNAADRAWAREHGVDPGGDIFVHGDKKWHWTKGCMAVTNEQIDEIFPLVAEGTPIVIRE